MAWSYRVDRPLRAPVGIEGQVFDRFEDRTDDELPFGVFACEGRRQGNLLICSDEVAFRTDLSLDLDAAPILRKAGPIYAGGPHAGSRGVAVSGDRYATSHKTIKSFKTIDALYFGWTRP